MSFFLGIGDFFNFFLWSFDLDGIMTEFAPSDLVVGFYIFNFYDLLTLFYALFYTLFYSLFCTLFYTLFYALF